MPKHFLSQFTISQSRPRKQNPNFSFTHANPFSHSLSKHQMASHHHHHCHTTPSTTTTVCCSSSSCTCSCSCIPSHHSPPTPQPQADPLQQALASHLLLLQSPHPNSPPFLKPHTTHQHIPHNQQQTHHQGYSKHRFPQDQDIHHHQSHTFLSSLLNRIDALESSFHHLSSSSSSSSLSYRSHSSLRDIAARTIQTHFRAFLVRRSRTLRHLKDLAFIKSAFLSLKSSLSDQTHLDPEALTHKAMDLLLRLDSIQGGDPMIRDGKRSISRDLVRFLEFVDGVSAKKRHGVSAKAVKNVRFAGNGNKSRVLGTNCRGLGGNQREIMEKLRHQVENIRGFSRVSENEEEDVELEGFQHVSDDEENSRVSIYGKNGVSQIRNGVWMKRHGVPSRVKKSVSFAENGTVSRVFGSTHEPISSGDVSIDAQRELMESLCQEVEEIGGFSGVNEDDEEAQMENGGSSQNSDGEGNPIRDLRSEGDYEISGYYQGQNGKFVFSAPVPVKMESRADLVKKRKGMKIITSEGQ